MTYQHKNKFERWPKQEIIRILNEAANLPRGMLEIYLEKINLPSSLLSSWREKYGWRGEKN